MSNTDKLMALKEKANSLPDYPPPQNFKKKL